MTDRHAHGSDGSGRPTPRFLTLVDVAETLNTSLSQVRALVTSQDLPAIKLGGRGQWRVEATALEDYIARLYRETREHLDARRDIPDAEAVDDVTEDDELSR